MKRFIAILLALGFLGLLSPLSAEYRQWEVVTVQVSATVQDSPPAIVLTWGLYPDGGSYTIQRRTTGLNTPWGPTIATVPNSATSWTDTHVETGIEYEYRITRNNAAGYIRVGIQLPLKDQWGKVIFLIDDTMATPLVAELNDMERMMVADGWQVVRQTVSRNATVPQIKATVVGIYQQDPANTRALYLFGGIPVPYSGNMVPDGHTIANDNHAGAWPADIYYGDMNGTWTDSSVNRTTASHSSDPTRNYNIPGDGKFDQNHAPGPVILEVGRVDLSNLPALQALGSETELLRNYIRKNRKFRYKDVDYARKMVIYCGFEWQPTRPASNGFREAAAFFGQEAYDRVESGEILPALQNTSYLWTRGEGPGWMQGSTGVGQTQNFVGVPGSSDPAQRIAYDPLSPFFTTFGSWFGDWDTPNNFLRAFLAAPGHSLTNAWIGNNHWFAHDLALGYNIGRPMRELHLNQNNTAHGYTLPFRDRSFFNGGARTHMALMGDPTLRIFVVAPPRNVAVKPQGQVSWNPSLDTSIVGYHIYRSAQELGPYSRLTAEPVAATSFSDPAPLGNAWYMVRTVKLETTGSGTFYNASQGILARSGGTPDTVLLTMATSGGGTTTPQLGTHSVDAGFPVQITAVADTGKAFNGWSASTGTTIANPSTPNTSVSLSANATVTANFVDAYGNPSWVILSPANSGAASGSYFPMNDAFDAQPAWDSDQLVPTEGTGGSDAPAFANRYGFIDFGPDYSTLRIVGTWTQYRSYSSGNQTPYAELWWDSQNGIAKVNAVSETRFNFNSAQSLPATGESEPWVQDTDCSAAPISPPRRYLILRSADPMTNRAREFAFVGYIEASGNTAPTLISPVSLSIQAGQTLQFTINATDPDPDFLTFSASGSPP